MAREIDPEIGRRVQAARGYAGLSQDALGDALGSSHTTIRAFEKSKEEPTYGELQEICKACNLTMEWFDLSREFTATSAAAQMDRIEQKLDALTAQAQAPSEPPPRTSQSKEAGTGIGRKVKVPARSGLKGSTSPARPIRKQKN